MSEGLHVRGLTVHAGTQRLVGPMDLDIRPGRPLTLLGETGAGKSLVAQAILGALPAGLASEGEITLRGERLDLRAPAERQALWGREIVMLPQEPWHALDPTMRAHAQVAETYRLVGGLNDASTAATDALAALDVAHAASQYPHALSGGMAQRVAFAAALAGGANAVVADEPTKGLDGALRDRVAGLLSSVTERGGLLLTITHDVTLARMLGGDVVLLQNGQEVERGPAAELLAAPRCEYGRALVAAEPGAWPHRKNEDHGKPLVTCRGLSLQRCGRTIIDGLDLTLHAGERIAITGPSGVGKSSLLDATAGLLTPAGGRIERASHLGRTDIQKLYQDPPAAFAARIPLRVSLADTERLHKLPPDRIAGLLDRLGVDPAILERPPGQVSGGELQRIALARIMALRPAVLLADEPTSRLDLVTQKRLMDLLGELADETDMAVLLVTHDPEIAQRWADRTIALAPLDERA